MRESEAQTKARVMTNVKDIFKKEGKRELAQKLGIRNPMAVPQLVKIVVNASTKEFLQDRKNLEKTSEELALITGQKPKVSKSRVSIASFKLREGDEIGLTVTLRRVKMYDFFEKLVKIVFPRMRDFSGIDERSFDGRGNISIGFSENTAFPEIDPGEVDKLRSLEVTIVTSAHNNEKAKMLLENLGMPFKKVKS